MTESFLANYIGHTYRTYSLALNWVIAVSQGMNLLAMTDIQFQEMLDRLTKRGLAATSLNLVISVMNSFYRFHGHIDNPASRVARPKIIVSQRQKLDEEKTRHIISVIPQTTIRGLRDRALFLSYARTGDNPRDWKWSDLKIYGQWAKYRSRQNNGNEHWKPMPSDVWVEISTYLHHAGRLHKMHSDEYIFTTGNGPISYQALSARLNYYARLAGVDGKFRPNDLRKVNLRPVLLEAPVSHVRPQQRSLHGIGRRS